MNIEYDKIYNEYEKKFETLSELANKLCYHLNDYLSGTPRIDRISARAKTPDRFTNKALKTDNGDLKYKKPFEEIQDQIGARIITYYLDDVDKISEIIATYYDEIEVKLKQPESHKEFSYIGKHFILFIPDEIRERDNHPLFFELQIKTLFQHAWAESEHDINYKTDEELSFEDKQFIAFSSAQAWGADKIFNDLYRKYD